MACCAASWAAANANATTTPTEWTAAAAAAAAAAVPTIDPRAFRTCLPTTNTCACDSDAGWDAPSAAAMECTVPSARGQAAFWIALLVCLATALRYFPRVGQILATRPRLDWDAVAPTYVLCNLAALATLVSAVWDVIRVYAGAATPVVSGASFAVQEALRILALGAYAASLAHMAASLVKISTIVRTSRGKLFAPSNAAALAAAVTWVSLTVCEAAQAYVASSGVELVLVFAALVGFVVGWATLVTRLSNQLLLSVAQPHPFDLIMCMVVACFFQDDYMFEVFGATKEDAPDEADVAGGGGSRRNSNASKSSKGSRENSRENLADVVLEGVNGVLGKSPSPASAGATTRATTDSDARRKSKRVSTRQGNGGNGNGNGTPPNTIQHRKSMRFARSSKRLERQTSKMMLSKGLQDRRRDTVYFLSRTTRMGVWTALFLLARLGGTATVLVPGFRFLGRAMELAFQALSLASMLKYLDDVYRQRLKKHRVRQNIIRKASKIAIQYVRDQEVKAKLVQEEEELKVAVAPWLAQPDEMATNFDPKMLREKPGVPGSRKSTLGEEPSPEKSQKRAAAHSGGFARLSSLGMGSRSSALGHSSPQKAVAPSFSSRSPRSQPPSTPVPTPASTPAPAPAELFGMVEAPPSSPRRGLAGKTVTGSAAGSGVFSTGPRQASGGALSSENLDVAVPPPMGRAESFTTGLFVPAAESGHHEP